MGQVSTIQDLLGARIYGSIHLKQISVVLVQEVQFTLQGRHKSPDFNSFNLHLKHLFYAKSQISSDAQEV